MDKQDDIKIAAALAVTTANKANDLAVTAIKTASDLATKTAETSSAINTNMEWMKKSLEGIESKLNEMDKAFVTSSQHRDVLIVQKDHEDRLRKMEDNQGKWLGAIAIITFIISMLIPYLLKLLKL